MRFTALMHHVYDIDALRRAYRETNPRAAAGVDGTTWNAYGENLEANLRDLSARLKRGAYRARPVRRTYIAKADGRQRPLGIPTLEDKIVQRAMTEVLNAVYEADFLGFSYGFRPGRGPHDALDALQVGLMKRSVSWVLDADIRGFFDSLDHEWLVKFIEHRIADRRVVRLIRKWLKAGVLEEGVRTVSETGTVQGGSISPLLANVYLHYVFDLWVQKWRSTEAQGAIVVVRYADDFVMGFEYEDEAKRFLEDLRSRLESFALSLHPEKTRLIEFGRYALARRRGRGQGKPETFDFLGFTHICAQTRKNAAFIVLRQTIRKRMRSKLREVKAELLRRRHHLVADVGRWLGRVMDGHLRYFGVPMNMNALMCFRHRVGQLWHRSLCGRSQTGYIRWDRMKRLMDRYVPIPRVCHPYPSQRLGVCTQGKSRMR